MIRNTLSDGANAEASSKTEYAMMSSINVGRRPKRSAINPNKNAPTGRIASVRKIASAIAETFVWNSVAIALTQKIRMKKSKASSDQPRTSGDEECCAETEVSRRK